MHITLIHQDHTDAALIARAIAALGHEMRQLPAEGEPAGHCDLLIVDRESAGTRLAEVIHAARARTEADLPVLCLMARSDSAEDLVAAREAGADDCLFHPIRAGELRARIVALLQQAYPDSRTPVEEERFGRFVFELHSGRLENAGRPVALTRKEFDLALLLFRHLGRPLSRAYMQEAVWGAHAEVPTRTIDTHVSRVRTKLGLRPENGYRLAPVYSYGYLLEALGH